MITAAARAFRIQRWSRALHDWIINGAVSPDERVVDNACPDDREAISAVYYSLEKADGEPHRGTARGASDLIRTWVTSPGFLCLPEDSQCILDLLVAVGMAVRSTPDGDFGHAVYAYPEPKEPAPLP